MTPAERAVQRCAGLDLLAQGVFLHWFDRGRADEKSGEDYGWRRVLNERGPVALAGYLEGVASVRLWGWARPRRRLGVVVEGAPAGHGTSSMYSNHRCRCAFCSAAKSADNAAYRQRQREVVAS